MKKIKPWLLGGLIAVAIPIIGVVLDYILICRHTMEFCGVFSMCIGYPWLILFYKIIEASNWDMMLIYLFPIVSVAIYFVAGALIGFGLSKISNR